MGQDQQDGGHQEHVAGLGDRPAGRERPDRLAAELERAWPEPGWGRSRPPRPLADSYSRRATTADHRTSRNCGKQPSGERQVNTATNRILSFGYANPPEHADQPLTYDDVELDDGSTILSVGRLQDLLLRNDPPTSRPSVRDAEVMRTRMGLPMPRASPDLCGRPPAP